MSDSNPTSTAAGGATMRAMVLRAHGGPENFEPRELPRPDPGPGEIRVAVHATSVNAADVGARRGVFHREEGGADDRPLVLGFDASGEVEALGEGVRGLEPGDAVVFGLPPTTGSGANAEATIVAAERVARKPAALPHDEAAALPVAGTTAWVALVDNARLALGERVLIHGAAGGVGAFAVQIARALGAEVFATCGAYDRAWVRELGAHHVLDYREDVHAAVRERSGGAGVEVVFDASGAGLLAESVAIAEPNGRLASATGPGDGLWMPAMMKNLSLFPSHPLAMQRILPHLFRLVATEHLRVPVGERFALADLGEAHRRLEEGGEAARGKFVIRVR